MDETQSDKFAGLLVKRHTHARTMASHGEHFVEVRLTKRVFLLIGTWHDWQLSDPNENISSFAYPKRLEAEIDFGYKKEDK